MVSRDLRDLQAPMVSKDLRVTLDLRDPRVIPVTLDLRDLQVRRGLRVGADRLMARHARMRPVLLGP